MTQISIFSASNINWYLYTDGASRGNPGHSGAGCYLCKENEPIEKLGFYLGIKTNNQAEYLALILGLIYASKYLSNHDILHIRLDSDLIVKQINGQYTVKNKHLKLLYQAVLELLPHNYTIEHVAREKNNIADALANKGIDKKIQDNKLLEILKKYEKF